MNAMKTRFAVAIFGALAASAASASTLVYTPINPSFGGNPNNGLVLLNSAQAENNTTDPDARDALSGLGGTRTGNTALDLFRLALQNAVLSRLTGSLVSTLVNDDGSIRPGTLNAGNFSITVADIGGGQLTITVRDITTNQSTEFTISSN